MSIWSADLLEYRELKSLVGRYIGSPQGKEILAHLAPSEDRAALDEALAEVREAIDYLRESASPKHAGHGLAVKLRFADLPDTTGGVRKLEIEGAVLEALEILELTRLLERAAEARAVLWAARERYPRLARSADRIPDLRPLLREVAGRILPDGTVSDDASPFLARVRRDIEKQKALIQQSLERFLRFHRGEHVLQEEFVTIRNERFVVPVIAGQQGKIEGVVHGASGSGHTLFFEPLETIELNNRLVTLVEQELQEVHRILRELTDRLREHAGAVGSAQQVLGELDFIFGKADFGIDFDCRAPRFSAPEERVLSLCEARHPLLEDVLRRQKRRVVPVSLRLDRRNRILLISGPNTGGKTVTLKTAGLLALMAQSGLPVPASEAEFPIFDQVLADIGDNQSIQESLSTFSAHIQRVRQTLEAATPDSLVLLDELGRATDPEEGGALGIAVVGHFRHGGAFTLASTHLLALKTYGAATEGVVNGSMGFNDETLEPTYVLRLGAPGKSAGLDIAQRLGIPSHVMARARASLGTREQDISRFLSQIHERLEDVTRLRDQLQRETRTLEATRQELSREFDKRESSRVRELVRLWEDLVDKFDTQAQAALHDIGESVEKRKTAEQAVRRTARFKREMQAEFETRIRPQGLTPQPPSPAPLRPEIAEGSMVRLKDLRAPARVRKVLGRGILEVEAGALRLKVPAEDVLEVLPAAAPRPVRAGISVEQTPRDSRALREINIIGQRAEEARNLVEKFIDDAALAGMSQVRIVHGHGMGVLKRAVAEILSHSPLVEKFYAAPPREGGEGATVAELRGWEG